MLTMVRRKMLLLFWGAWSVFGAMVLSCLTAPNECARLLSFSHGYSAPSFDRQNWDLSSARHRMIKNTFNQSAHPSQ